MVSQQGGELSSYEVEVNGIVTTLRLTDRDAELRGLKKPPRKAAAKSKTPANKAAAPGGDKQVSAAKQAVADRAFGGAAKQRAAAEAEAAGDGA